MFVILATNLVARVKLGQLAASFVEDPEAAFPPGTLVKGRILSVQGDRSALPPYLHTLECLILNECLYLEKLSWCAAEQCTKVRI